MNTLITPAQAVALAFADGEYLAPESVTQSDIAAAEQRYLVPVIGRLLYEMLLSGSHAGFTTEYLAAPAALFTRIALQPRLDVRILHFIRNTALILFMECVKVKHTSSMITIGLW